VLLLIVTPPPVGEWGIAIRVSVCAFLCVFVYLYLYCEQIISRNKRPISTNFFVHVMSPVRSSSISVAISCVLPFFMDDIMLARN